MPSVKRECIAFANGARRMEIHGTLEPVVLIANSNEPARTWIESTLISAGLHTESFPTAAALLDRFRPDTATCVVLDISLSDAGGLELQAHLASAGASTLFLTRERSIATCVKALKAGAIDFLTLPCDANELVRTTRSAVMQAVALWSQRIQFGALRSRYEKLSPREREVFLLVSSGLLNKQIAQRLAISEITVQIHRSRVMRKMSAPSFASLVRMADALQPMRPGLTANYN
jgi:FixJ family two-component response regulator